MTESHSLNVKLSDLQLDKSNSATKNVTGATSLFSDMKGTDETNFPYNLLLTEKQFTRFARFLQVIDQRI